MTDRQVWFITGAGRGMGVDFAKAALAAGRQVVAAGRTPDTVRAAIGEAGDPDDLLVVRLDVTVPAERCAGQQGRELLRRLFRGADPGADR
jgi:NAD(P)-dependent dehydrogenase (short-subunit alcohol dehydrogenase family)